MRKIYLLAAFILGFQCCLFAQYVITTPTFPKDTGSISIIVDVSKGNKALLNYASPDKIYIHTGVILGNNPSPWDSVPFAWGTANAAAKLSPLGNNRYRFTIPDIRALYKVPANTPIRQIAFLLRDEAGNVVQRNADGTDMYIQLYGNGLASKFLDPAFDPYFTPKAPSIQKSVGDRIQLAYASNKNATLRLYLNGTLLQETNGTVVTDSLLISAPGSQEIIGWASDGTTTRSDTLRFFVAAPVVTAPLPAGVRDGINYQGGDTSVVLVLYAPGKGRVSVIGDFNNYVETSAYQMNVTPDGKRFWLRISGLQPGKEYLFQYLVNSNLRIAEPYAEKLLDPNNDPFIPSGTYPSLTPYPTGKTTGIVSVLQTAAPGYNWQTNNFARPDKGSMVVYELLLRDFLAQSNWQTLKDTVGYLKRLGINAIELMPINEFEGNLSWGYNPSFYFAPDKYYGTKNKLKEFIDYAHSQGIAVIMDVALNHSFSQSPLVQLYYDAAQNRPDPSNPWFNPVAKHAFNVGFDMNHESAATKYFTSRVVEHWLKEYRVDGFRFDLSKGFTQTQTCTDAGASCDVGAWSSYDASRVAIWKAYYDSIQLKSPGAYVILEHFADNTEERVLADYGMLLWGNLNGAFAQATTGNTANSNFESGLFTARGWTNPHLVGYMESHDEERIMYRNMKEGNSNTNYTVRTLSTAVQRSGMAAAFLLTMPGPKMIWQFGEMGYDYSINTCENGSVSENCRLDRKPIRWDFRQVFERNHLLEVYTALLKLRQHPAYKANFTSDRVDRDLGSPFKWLRLTTDTSNLVVVGNFDLTKQSASVVFPGGGTWYDYLSGATFNATGTPQNITLEPGEYHIYLNRNITNVLTPVLEVPGTRDPVSLQVAPNPATGASVIRYDLPEAGPVILTLKNATGQVLGQKSYRMLPSGRHLLTVNELNSSTKGLAKGVYFIQLKVRSISTVISIFIR